VTARFEDGSFATSDVLIGADGASSHVRAQLLPQAKRIETGIMAVSGKLELNDDIRRATPAAMFRGPTLILGPKGCFLFGNATGAFRGHLEGIHQVRFSYDELNPAAEGAFSQQPMTI
jgi:hypothetical protein